MTTLIDVPTSGTPKQTIRVDGELWKAYGKACEAEGTSRAEDIREHMKRKIAAHKQSTAPASTPSDDQPES